MNFIRKIDKKKLQKFLNIFKILALICFGIATIGIIYFDQHNNKQMGNKFVWFYLPFVLFCIIGLIIYNALPKDK